MPGPRQPTDVIIANGRKHLSKAEEEARRSSELTVPAAARITVPEFLPKELRKAFRSTARLLADNKLYTELDADNLARYIVAQHQYELATVQTEAAMEDGAYDEADSWSRLQDRFFKQASGTAATMGLTVSSRCRLVIPDVHRDEAEADDPFTIRLLERQKASSV